MKLAVITTYATPTNMRRELLEAIAARGHDITLVSPESAGMSDTLASLGGRYRAWQVDRTGIDPIGDLRALRALHAILRDVRPEVVLVYQIKGILLAPLAARLARVPRVVALINGLGSAFDEHGFGLTWKARLARVAYGLSLRNVDQIIFQNRDDPDYLRAARLLPSDASWRVVPGSGVDLVKLAERTPHAGAPVFTLMSRLLISKGIREFVAAARIVRQRHPQARFWLVGQFEAEGHPDGVTRGEVEAWVAEGLIEYRGFTQDVGATLGETTVFVLPSYYREGVPRTNLEALAVGRPVVTTDWVGCRDTVEHGVNGFLVPPRDAAALAEMLERYLREPTLVAGHGRASRRLAERRFDIRLVNEQVVGALEAS